MPAHMKCTVRKSERLRIILVPELFMEQTKLMDGALNIFEQMYGETVKSAPVDTGEYQLSWTRRNYQKGNKYIFEMRNSAKHAKFLIYGMDINYRRFIRTSMGWTGKTYRYPDPMRGILHDVRRIVWNHKQQFLKEFQQRKIMYKATTGRRVTVSNIRAVTSFTKGARYR
jgi:hypothetical protein